MQKVRIESFLEKLYHIIEMCKVKYFICDPVSVTKKNILVKSNNYIEKL